MRIPILTPHKIPVKNGLVLWLAGRDFLNSPTTSLWLDRCGNNNNVVPSGFGYTSSSGRNGLGSVVFDGVDDTFISQSNITIVGNQPRTLEITVSGIVDTGTKYLIGYGTSASNGATFIIYALGGKYYFSGWGTADLASATTISNGLKYTLACVYDGTTIKLYANGVLSASRVCSLNTDSNQKLYIDHSLACNVYDAKLYNRALTDSEILQNYNFVR